jgi:uncharacterized protein (TIGR02271 family)
MKNFQERDPNLTSDQNTAEEAALEGVIGYDVLDREGNGIGRVEAVWTDHTGQPAFLGVKTGWLLGKTHVVPAYSAEVNYPREHVRVPYSREDVKNAPSYNPEDDLSSEREEEICAYYGARGPVLRETQATAGSVQAEQGQSEYQESRSQGSGDTTIPLHEEELKIGKREVETGGVRLRKIVRTETVERPVELRHEDIVVERVPAGERQAGTMGTEAGQRVFEGEEVYIPLRREEAVVEKDVRVREEIRARKTSETQRENVSGEIRREDVEIEENRGDERELHHEHRE